MIRPYVYQPDEEVDFGAAGKAPITVWAWLGEETPGYELPVTIICVKAQFPYRNPKGQELDVTEAFNEDGRMLTLAREIREHILAQREREWESEPA